MAQLKTMNTTMKTTAATMKTIAFAALIILLIAIPAHAIVLTPTTPTREKSKPACQRADADKNPFCKGYATAQSGKGGWKVATGKIILGTPTRPTNKYGRAEVLSGLSGLVTPKDEKPMTLSQKADLKAAVKKNPPKYMNLVDFIKERDTQNSKLRR